METVPADGADGVDLGSLLRLALVALGLPLLDHGHLRVTGRTKKRYNGSKQQTAKRKQQRENSNTHKRKPTGSMRMGQDAKQETKQGGDHDSSRAEVGKEGR